MLKKRHIIVEVGQTGEKTIFEAKMAPKSSRIDFEIKKYANGAAYGMNTASIELYNLAEDTFKSLNKKENPIVVKAGYEGQEQIIFNGRIGNALRIKKNASDKDVIVNLLCSSGIRLIQQFKYTESFSKATANSPSLEIQQFLKNMLSKIKVIDNGVVKQVLDISIAFIPKLDGSQISGYIKAPHTFDASILDILVELSNNFDFNFQIEEAKIIIRPREQDPTKLIIKPETGLIGIPEITEQGIDFKTFLNPQLESGMAFTINSRYSNFKLGALEFLDRTDTAGTMFNARKVNEYGRYEGSYRILSLIHKGSSHMNEWQTEITAQNYKMNYISARGQ